jgi:membrane protein YdbS with pleckstrin-like domain
MLEQLSPPLLRFLRVPAEPAPPPGDPRLLRTFRAAPQFFRYKVATWGLKQLGAAAGLLFSYFFFQNVAQRIPFGYFGLIEQLFILAFLAQLPFSFALLRLDFEMRWYMLSDRSLRIRHGILKVREQTITFANVQNISIRQNPLQRLFGVSTVAVRAAGGGGGNSQGTPGSGAGDAHEATFEGIADAESIRNLIRERVRMFRDSGLGDPDEVRRLAPGGAPARQHRHGAGRGADDVAGANAAAHRLLGEMRSLRAALHRG